MKINGLLGHKKGFSQTFLISGSVFGTWDSPFILIGFQDNLNYNTIINLHNSRQDHYRSKSGLFGHVQGTPIDSKALEMVKMVPRAQSAIRQIEPFQIKIHGTKVLIDVLIIPVESDKLKRAVITYKAPRVPCNTAIR